MANANDKNNKAIAGATSVALGLCIFFSGAAALIYQVAWAHQFAFVFGSSEFAVVAVSAAYMAGLAGGAAVAARLIRRVTRPIRTFALLEAGIAVSALAVPVLLAAVRSIYVLLLGDQPAPPDAGVIGTPLFAFIVALIVLALPAGLLGITLPLLTRYTVRLDRDVGRKVALLYGLNMLGAALGATAAGFLLLPSVGLNGTVWIGAAINLAIFAVVAGPLRRKLGVAAEQAADTAPAGSRTPSAHSDGVYASCIAPWFTGRSGFSRALTAQPAWILPVMLGSGAVAFIYAVLWTRLLTHVIGLSVYSLATILAAFLAGIGLGSGIAARAAIPRQPAAVLFVFAQLAIALLSITIFTALGPLIPASGTMMSVSSYAVGVLLPATVFIGATFPLAVRILTENASGAGRATARILAWNTSGAIAGATLAVFVLLPKTGFTGSIKLAAAGNCALALWVACCIAPRRVMLIGATAGSLLLCALVYAPARPQAVIAASGLPINFVGDPREVFYAVGRSATVLVLEENGVYYLRTNGLPEASIMAEGSPPAQDAGKWLAALPVAARPNAASMLLVGLGGGALDGVPASVRAVDVIELEPAVIEAYRALGQRRDRDPLQDERVNLIVNDARNALRLTNKRYDVIVSQASHPRTSTASHLYTRDFLLEAEGHLTEGGVLVQRINSEFVDLPLLRSMTATLLSVFDNVRLYYPAEQVLAFLASDEPIEAEIRVTRTGKPITDDVMHYSRMGMNGVEDLLAALVIDETGVVEFAAGAPVSTDDNLLLATRSRYRADGLTHSDLDSVFKPHDPLLNHEGWVYSRLGGRTNFAYVAQRLIRRNQQARAARLAEIHPDESTRALIVGLLYAARDQSDQANSAYRTAVELDPSNAQARFLSISRNLAMLAQGNAADDVTERARSLPASAAAVIQGWQYAAQQDWQSLAQIDGPLGRAGVTDMWYPEAVRLRVEWRSKVTSAPESYAFDALRLIDRAVLIEPDRNLFLLRAAIGIALRDGRVATESSHQVVRLARASLRQAQESDTLVSQRDLLIMRQNLTAIVTNLRGDLVSEDPRRAEDVSRSANELIRYIDSVLPPADGE
jgi:spermidine synthase